MSAKDVVNAVMPKHSKDSILRSKRWGAYRDLLGVLLEDGKEYTSADVEQKIKKYTEGKIA